MKTSLVCMMKGIIMKHFTYLFDFDGTLVDSMPFWSQKMINILEKSKVEYPDDIIKTIATLGDLGTAEYFRENLGVQFSIEEMFLMMDEYALPKYRDEIPLKEGVREYLAHLKENGCSLNILTASPHKMLDPCLKRLGVYDMFDNVWSSDDFNLSKVDPEIYHAVSRKLGVSENEIAFFDDNVGALSTAAQAGLYIVGVFDESAEAFNDRVKTVSDVYFATFKNKRMI